MAALLQLGARPPRLLCLQWLGSDPSSSASLLLNMTAFQLKRLHSVTASACSGGSDNEVEMVNEEGIDVSAVMGNYKRGSNTEAAAAAAPKARKVRDSGQAAA